LARQDEAALHCTNRYRATIDQFEITVAGEAVPAEDLTMVLMTLLPSGTFNFRGQARPG
jgi:hypothetical protein